MGKTSTPSFAQDPVHFSVLRPMHFRDTQKLPFQHGQCDISLCAVMVIKLFLVALCRQGQVGSEERVDSREDDASWLVCGPTGGNCLNS